MQWCLRKKSVGRGNTQYPTERRGGTQQNNVPGKAAGFFRAIPIDRANDTADLMVEKEENGNDEPRDDRPTYPGSWQMPELNEEGGAIRAARSESSATDLQCLLVQRRQLAHVRQADEDDDADCGRILCKSHANVSMEQRLPALGS